MSKFKGFGFLLKNEKGEWTINGEVIEFGEELMFSCPFKNWEYEDALSYNGQYFWKGSLEDVRVSSNGSIQLWFDSGDGPWGTPNIHWTNSFAARRSCPTMVA